MARLLADDTEKRPYNDSNATTNLAVQAILRKRVATSLVDALRGIVVDNHGIAPKRNWIKSFA